ncbi:hypothetical protein D3C81_654260 [compost metagenome]
MTPVPCAVTLLMPASVVLLMKLLALLPAIDAVPASAPAMARVLVVASAAAVTSTLSVTSNAVPSTEARVVSPMVAMLIAAPMAAVPLPATAPARV